ETATDVEAPGRDDATGAGLLNAGAAVRAGAARFPLRSAFRDQSCPSVVAAGGRTALWFELANTGGRSWTRSGADRVSLATARPAGRSSAFYTPGVWTAPERAGGADQETVEPGGVARFGVVLTAPDRPGVYREY